MKVINFFAGPGTGKSTMAALTFSKLKQMGVNCELIQEFAKDKTWERHPKVLTYQPYITGKQYWKQAKLLEEVEIAVTDSPLLLGCIYPGFGCGDNWDLAVIDMFNAFDNVNFFLKRNEEVHAYSEKGRSQTREEAEEIDHRLEKLLWKNEIHYHTVPMGQSHDGAWKDIYRVLEKEGLIDEARTARI